MSPTTPLRLLLGPQRPVINIHTAIAEAGIGDEPIGVISAAWQEAEGDIQPLQQLLDNPLTDLNVYQKADQLFAADKPLHEIYRLRQERLKEQQRLYRLRLRQLMIAAWELLRTEGDPTVLAEERRHAIAQVRALDRHHLRQVEKAHARCDNAISSASLAMLSDYRNALAEELEKYQTLLITGGNVVVLMNRLRLFGLDKQLRHKNIVAWSAGAMVLCEHIVLFHDRMPQGRRDSEIMCAGMGILPHTVLLPDPHRRLRTKDASRIKLFSRRFAPATCVTLSNGSSLLFAGDTLKASTATKYMSRKGQFVRVRAA